MLVVSGFLVPPPSCVWPWVQEEDRIILREIAILKSKLADKRVALESPVRHDSRAQCLYRDVTVRAHTRWYPPPLC